MDQLSIVLARARLFLDELDDQLKQAEERFERSIHILSVSNKKLFRFEKFARMRKVMLARQWCAVADECFAAMVTNRQVV